MLRNTLLYRSVGNWWGVVSMVHAAGGWFADSDAPGAVTGWVVGLGWVVWATLAGVVVVAVRRAAVRGGGTDGTDGTDGAL